MNIQRILILLTLILSIAVFTGLNENSEAGPGAPTTCSTCNNIDSCNGLCNASVPGGCFWDGDSCEAGSPPPGNCTVSVTGNIQDSLVCICQAQSKKGKDTFKVITCGDTDEEEDCAKRQGEVKQYINADPSGDTFTFDCSEIDCNDFCIRQ